MVQDTGSSTVRFYNTDYTTLWKTITVPSIAGYKFSSLSFVSDKLFNLDGNVEYAAIYNMPATFTWKTVIYSESGSVILDCGNTYFPAVTNFNGDYKLVIGVLGEYNTKFYSLPGSLPCNSCGGATGFPTPPTGKVSPAVPNPSTGTVTISAEFPNGINAGTVSLSDINGHVLQTLQVYGTQPSVTFSTTGYAPGNYVYTLNASGMQPTSGILSITR